MPLSENIQQQDYLPKRSPKSHFFTTLNSFTQSIDQCFGPVNGNLVNEFQVTSKFTITSGVKAFACCKASVLVQPQIGNTGKVNLVLRPFTQPMQEISINTLCIEG